MNSRLISSPDFTIRQIETPAEIEVFVHLNAAVFRPDEDVDLLGHASTRSRHSARTRTHTQYSLSTQRGLYSRIGLFLTNGGSTMHPTDSDEQKSGASTIRLAYGPEPLQFGELYLPDNLAPYPVVILIHGGYWRARYGLDLMIELAKDLAARGAAAWNIEYRRVGNAGGGWPGTFLDVALAADYLRTVAQSHNLDLRRVIPIGHSAGGHLAFWLAARQNLAQNSPLVITSTPLSLAGAISLAGVVDLELAWRLNLSNGAVIDLLEGGFDTVPERYMAASPAVLLPLGTPQVLIHGTADDSVPLQMSLEYTAKAKAANDPVTFIELDGVDHFALIDPKSDAWAVTIGELERLLGAVGL